LRPFGVLFGRTFGEVALLYMVIEHFKDGQATPIYARFREQGRLAPDGLRYVSSWVDVSLRRCYQVMECDDAALLSAWVARWHDLVTFEIVTVITSTEAARIMNPPDA